MTFDEWFDRTYAKKTQCNSTALRDIARNAFLVGRDQGKISGLEDCMQIAHDATSDDPQPGTWNDACEHIRSNIKARSNAVVIGRPGADAESTTPAGGRSDQPQS